MRLLLEKPASGTRLGATPVTSRLDGSGKVEACDIIPADLRLDKACEVDRRVAVVPLTTKAM
jgi:hypothetical protein